MPTQSQLVLKKADHNSVIIGLGSNISPHDHIELALQALSSQFTIINQSPLVVTAPVAYLQQPSFINASVLIETTLTPDELKQRLLNIESTLGRVRTSNKNGPRTIDLDILVWNNHVVDADFDSRLFLQELVLSVLD